MPLFVRTKLSGLVASVAILAAAAACGSHSPTSPSHTSSGAVIAGVVLGGQSVSDAAGPHIASIAAASSPFAGLSVQVMGTSLSSVVAGDGSFQIAGVPAGSVKLQFTGTGVNAQTHVDNVQANQFVSIQVQVSASAAIVVSDERTEKLSICHTEGTGDYHLIDISADAEAAHRAHGDAKVGEPVPGQPGKTFDGSCRPVGPSIDIKKYTNDQDADDAPGPSITVGSTVTWKYVVKNTGTIDLTSVSVTDDHNVTISCNGQTSLAAGASMTCTATGIATAIGPYQNVGTVTAHWSSGGNSGSVTDSDPSHYLGISPITIKKFTNGEDADSAPGPSIVVGQAVTWEYDVKNIGTIGLTGLAVADDRGVAVNCSGQTTLAAGATITCTGSGTATLGQYSNVGTATAHWSAGGFSGTVTASDPSHYLGVSADQDTPKVELCHRTGAGFYVLIDVSVDAEPAHRAHGDAKPGEAVPGQPGKTFTASCGVK